MSDTIKDVPVFQEEFYPRPRLGTILDHAFKKPLIVVHAGAGFGKTMAVSKYLTASDYRTVWFSCSGQDNIPARFWAHLIRVFAQHRPELGRQMKALGFPATLQMFDHFLNYLTAELYQDKRTVAFVFDDVHLVTEPAVLNFLASLITARLENSSIILLTRIWPLAAHPAPAADDIVTAEDLRFSLAETEAYLNRSGIHTNAAALERIHHYVSGWPMALSLVTLALKRGNQDTFDEFTLNTAKPALYELFEQEIFSQYTPAEQDILIKLSILDSFPRGLVQAITGEPHRNLSWLLGSNIFIRYAADTMRLFFSPMYLDFLHEKLQSIQPDELNITYRKAGDWCRDNGHYYDAVTYYRQCGLYQEQWDTLMKIDACRHTKRDAEFFISQISEMPEEFTAGNPMARIVLAVLQINNMQLTAAAQILDQLHVQLESMPRSNESRELLGEYYIARGFLLLGMEQNGFEDYFKRAAALLPGGSRRWGRKLLLIDLGPGLNLQNAAAGELEKSLACFCAGVPFMAKVLHGAGQGLDMLCQAEAFFLTGNPKKAIEPAYRALYAARSAAQYDIVGNTLFMLLRIYTALGDYKQILNTMEHVELYESENESQNLGIWDITRGWYFSEVNEPERVAGWIRHPDQKGFAPISVDRALLIRLRCLISAGQYAESLVLIDYLKTTALNKTAIINLLYIELSRAIVHSQLKEMEQAAAALRSAYLLARGNHLYMPFIESGNRTRLLINRVRQVPGHGLPEEWLNSIYTKASTYAKRHAYITGRYRRDRSGYLVDYGLSRRESEFLANLSQGLTREEIADNMGLSLNTVKSMAKHIFAKLGAINAADAVRIAFVNKLI